MRSLESKMENPLLPSIELPENKILKDFSKDMEEKTKRLLESLTKFLKNHQDGKEIRGEIVTAIIDLEEKLSEIILNYYITPEKRDSFLEDVLLDRNFPLSLKKDIVDRTGLLDKQGKLKENIEFLITTRNLVAHSRYKPTIEEVLIFNIKKEVPQTIQDLKNKFDEIFEKVMKSLDKILEDLAAK